MRKQSEQECEDCYAPKGTVCSDMDCPGKRNKVGPLEHVPSPNCWCEPEIDYIDPDTGTKVFVHKRPQQGNTMTIDTKNLRTLADAARYQAPVAQSKDVDEYGPRLDWFKHWTTFPEGTKLYVHAQGDPV